MAALKMNQDLLSGLQNTTTLRKTDESERQDRSAANPAALASPDVLEEEEARWKYFFDTGCENWFELIKDQTFTSTFCSLKPEEASIIVKHWEDKERILQNQAISSIDNNEDFNMKLTSLVNDAKSNLSDLFIRLDDAIKKECDLSPCNRVFVKLATRSPKDSKIILKNAEIAFHKRIQELEEQQVEVDDNLKWIILSEEVTKASSVSSAAEAIELLLDSARVFEDLEYALRGPPDAQNKQPSTTETTTGAAAAYDREWQMNLVARAWDPRVKPSSEFRGICWNNKLTCLAQYFHPLYFEELQSPEMKAMIEEDIRKSFKIAEGAVAALGGNCIIDFAWLGKGEVLIVELNPFDGVCLGTFPASTGLFLFENPTDQNIMKGNSPFEFRIRETKLSSAQLGANGNAQWREIIKPMKHVIA